MPSPELLPQGRSLPVAAPPSLDVVIDKARRRRRVQGAVVGAISAAAAVVAVVVLTPGATPGSLKVVTPTQGLTSSPQPSHAATPSALVGPVARPAHKHSAPAARATSTARAQDSATPGVSAAPEGSAIIGPPHRVIGYDATRACNGSGPTPATGWCSYYDGATSGTAGRSVVLATAVCRLPGQGTATLVSGDGQQADFGAGVRGYPPVWAWSHGERFARGPTSLTVAENTCIEWYVDWNVVDDAGRPLRPGTYYLDATPMVDPSNSQATASQSDPGSFTVR